VRNATQACASTLLSIEKTMLYTQYISGDLIAILLVIDSQNQ